MSNDRFKFRVLFECRACGKKHDELFQLILFARYSIGCECGKVLKFQTDITIISISQCTGLKDKNGKLIFEGDSDKVHGDVRWSPMCGSYVVENSKGILFLKEFDALNQIEIVGNIHEETK